MRSASAALLALGLWLTADAHHSVAVFDARRMVKIEGTVTEFRWINPHAYIEIDGVAESETAVNHWSVEMQAPNSMSGEGWRRDTLVTGAQVTVFAHPPRSPDASGRRRALYAGIIRPDGRTLGRIEADNR